MSCLRVYLGPMEPNDVNSSSYSETDGSSSSIRTSEVNSTSTQAPQSSANHSGSSIQLSCHSCHVLQGKAPVIVLLLNSMSLGLEDIQDVLEEKKEKKNSYHLLIMLERLFFLKKKIDLFG